MLFGGNSSASKKRKAVWEESAELDRGLELSHGSAKVMIIDRCLVGMGQKIVQHVSRDP